MFELFGSKLGLQLAVIDHAQQRFVREVIDRIDADRQPRLAALADAWFDYLERRVFPGGCILTSLSTEYDSRTGPLHDRVVEMGRSWLDYIATFVEADQAAGLIDPDADPAQVAFEVRGAFVVTNWAFQLFDDPGAIGRGRAMLTTITTAHGLPAHPRPGRNDGNRRRRAGGP